MGQGIRVAVLALNSLSVGRYRRLSYQDFFFAILRSDLAVVILLLLGSHKDVLLSTNTKQMM